MSIARILKSFPSLHAGLTVGSGTAVRLATGLGKTKFAAIFLGASGVGFLGIGGQMQMLGITWGSLSMGAGFIRGYGRALAEKDEIARREFLSTAFSLLCMANALLAGLMLLFHRWIGSAIFGSSSHGDLVLAAAIGITFQSFIGAYFQSILYAHGRYDSWSRSNALGAVVELGFFAAGIWLYGISGAFWGLAIGMVFWAVMVLWECTRVESAQEMFTPGISLPVVKELGHSSLTMSLTGSFAYFSGMVIRVKLLERFGAEINGGYQASSVISALYSQIVLNSIWASFYPMASKAKSEEEISSGWAESITVTAGSSALFQATILLAPAFILELIFRHGFDSALDFLVWQLAGDFFFLLAQPALAVFLAQGRFRLYACTWSIYYGLTIALPLLLFPYLGATAVTISYFAASLLLSAFTAAVFVARRPAFPLRFWLGPVALGAAVTLSALGGKFFVGGELFALRALCWAAVAGLIAWAVANKLAGKKTAPKSRLPLKTKFFNIPRGLLLVSGLDSILAKACASGWAPGWMVKLAPNHYQYPAVAPKRVSREGFNFELNVGDFLDWHVYYGQMEGAKERLYDLARAGDVVIDVGANIGETALHLGRRVGASGRIFAFEPDPQMREKCLRNMQLNRPENIELEPYALSDRAGEYRLFRVAERNPAGNRIMEREAPGVDSVVVKAQTLDDYAEYAGIKRVSLIKIDVEGFEQKVLMGAERLLRNCRPKLFIELSDRNLREQQSSPEELLRILDEWGYTVVEAVSGESMLGAKLPEGLHCDVICTPRPEAVSR